VQESLFGRPDHALQIADAFGAFGPALTMTKDLGRPAGAAGYGRAGVAFSNAIAVADVHGPARLANSSHAQYVAPPTRLQLILMSARRFVSRRA
jgi:hypothetical protein